MCLSAYVAIRVYIHIYMYVYAEFPAALVAGLHESHGGEAGRLAHAEEQRNREGRPLSKGISG